MLKYAVVAAAALAVTPAAAGSKCSTKMLEADWYAFINRQGGSQVRCTSLKFDKGGNVASSACREDYYNRKIDFQGQLTIKKSCQFSGSFRVLEEGKYTKEILEFNGAIDANGNILISLLMGTKSDYYEYVQSEITATRK